MSSTPRRSLSVVEAARLLFRTPTPDDQQIGRVFERMKSGALRVHQRGRNPREWTTTEESLAEFMANEMLKRQRAAGSTARAPRRVEARSVGTAPVRPSTNARAPARRPSLNPRKPNAAADDMRGVYRGIWRDYFMAVMLRKRMAHRSVAFHRAVLAGQVAMLLAIVGLAVGTWQSLAPTPAEHQSIKRHLAEATDTFRVERWHPGRVTDDGSALLVEVEYRYTKESPRVIHTRRTFRVSGEEVSEVTED
ncbi:MAG: hypothetical protein AB7U73_08765 [Pirellulales bacterium]